MTLKWSYFWTEKKSVLFYLYSFSCILVKYFFLQQMLKSYGLQSPGKNILPHLGYNVKIKNQSKLSIWNFSSKKTGAKNGKQRHENYHIKGNWSHSRKNDQSHHFVASIYSKVEFKIMKWLKAMKSLSPRRKELIIRKLEFSKLIRLIFLILFMRINLLSE